ncbi:MAG: bifunctional oligoribonuclease/PAP phosphatase NrnA [Fimbriimonadales bacterium]|nr:bifunctional oligoribonuclease/PAP phosphatase NrnA [Fimbriimonadales bacterium]
MRSRDTFQRAAGLIAEAESFLIVPHLHPDGDALGSALGLYHALKQMGKSVVTVVSHDSVPEIYRFLPDWDKILLEHPHHTTYDLAIVVDQSQLSRAGKHEQLARAARRMLQIDHHVPLETFAEVRIVDTSAAATAELVYRLLHAMRLPLTPEIATCLLTGIVTDTFSFKFPNTTPRTLRIAAALQQAGADLSYISEQVFETRSFSAVKLLGLALASLQRTRDGAIAWVTVPRRAFEEAHAHEEETEGIVNFVRSIRGVEVAMMLRESPNGKIRASLRSRGKVNVAKLAQQFDGGGHENAAGCTLETSLAEAEMILVREAQRWMESST